MNIFGDIGNTEVKICFYSSNNNLIKKLTLKTSLINQQYLNKNFSLFFKKKLSINYIIFSSVVPRTYKIFKLYLEKNFKTKCCEVKDLNLNKLNEIRDNRFG